MATLSSGDHNLESLGENSKIKKKYTKTRSRAYRRKRAAKRRKQSITKSRILQRYLNNKGKRLEMLSESVRNISELPSLLPQSSASYKGDEAAFWKSQAISLQYENRMLHKHIEEIYSQIIESKLSITYKEPNENEPNNEEYYDENEANSEVYYDGNDETCEEQNNEEHEENEVAHEELYMNSNKKSEKEATCEESLIEPPKQNKKEREKEMAVLYGNSYRKIMGMETVIQMQYEVTLDKEKINYWPVLPIKL